MWLIVRPLVTWVNDLFIYTHILYLWNPLGENLGLREEWKLDLQIFHTTNFIYFATKEVLPDKIRKFFATMGVQPEVVDVNRKLTPFFNASQDEPKAAFSTSLSQNFTILAFYEAIWWVYWYCRGGGGVWNAIHTSYVFLYNHWWSFFPCGCVQ